MPAAANSAILAFLETTRVRWLLCYNGRDFWGRSASTWAAKLQGRAEVQATSLIRLQTIVANDDNYALAA